MKNFNLLAVFCLFISLSISCNSENIVENDINLSSAINTFKNKYPEEFEKLEKSTKTNYSLSDYVSTAADINFEVYKLDSREKSSLFIEYDNKGIYVKRTSSNITQIISVDDDRVLFEGTDEMIENHHLSNDLDHLSAKGLDRGCIDDCQNDCAKTRDDLRKIPFIGIYISVAYYVACSIQCFFDYDCATMDFSSNSWSRVDFPFAVKMGFYSDKSSEISGTFIAPNVIITCANGVNDPNENVRVPSLRRISLITDVQADDTKTNRFDFTSSSGFKVYQHEKYYQDKDRYDIAIVILPDTQKYIKYDNETRIVIPNSSDELNYTKPGSAMEALFYDYTPGKQDYYVSSRRAKVMSCRDKTYFEPSQNDLADELLCISFPSDDNGVARVVYGGNSGGGFFNRQEQKYYFLGTVKSADVLMRIATHKEWIKRVLRENDILLTMFEAD